ncbi:MAG: N-acetylmannosamine-6-phosphate 2-epimerase [Bryobacteraceae bacterium]
MIGVFESMRGGLIVSCQSEGDDPFNQPPYLALFAKAAEMGGAVGIRAQGAANITAIAGAVSLPVIGITKSTFPDGSVLVTGDFADVEAVTLAGAAAVALDATDRVRPNGMRGAAFLVAVRAACQLPLMADISTLEEGDAALLAGADVVATTLSGYTPDTQGKGDEPDWELLQGLLRISDRPVIVEGRVWTPDQARRALDLGAHAVVVGTAITRPRVVTRKFVDAMRAAG